MTIDELKMRLGKILAEEEGDGPADWNAVEFLSGELAEELDGSAPLIVDAYLRGAERRRQDSVFAHAQRSELLSFLRGDDGGDGEAPHWRAPRG